MSDFNSSDEESNNAVDTTPLVVDWLDMSQYGYSVDLGVSALPGCRFKDTWRSLKADVETIKSLDVQDIFVLCTKGELHKYRSYKLLESYKEEGFVTHHHSFPDGQAPSFEEMTTILQELKETLKEGKKTLIHCYGGLGRSCLVLACLLLLLDEKLESEAAIEKVKGLRGPVAIQSIKQFNFINDFRDKQVESEASKDDSARSISR